MASDQIEYCGGCENYPKCRALAIKGKLVKCVHA